MVNYLKESTIILVVTFVISAIAANPIDNIAKIMEDNEIVPDIIDVAPTELIEINYPNDISISPAAEFTPTQVKNQPTLKWNTEDNALYTLIMTDPDAPSRADPKLKEVRHWLVVNIPGSDVSAGDSLFDFIGSGPPKDTGLHRYIFLVYKQNDKINYDGPRATNKSGKVRLSTSTKEFVTKYNLGNPIAGNFYQAQYDDYVPELHAQLTE